jgi:hypothetical protein
VPSLFQRHSLQLIHLPPLPTTLWQVNTSPLPLVLLLYPLVPLPHNFQPLPPQATIKPRLSRNLPSPFASQHGILKDLSRLADLLPSLQTFTTRGSMSPFFKKPTYPREIPTAAKLTISSSLMTGHLPPHPRELPNLTVAKESRSWSTPPSPPATILLRLHPRSLSWFLNS